MFAKLYGLHLAMHLETLLYMLLQSGTTVPPPGVRPDFHALADEAKVHEVDNEWFTIPSSTITLGLQDPENDDPPNRFFGWDNERPPHSVHVPAFQAKARAITNAEYVQYLQATGKSGIPASWTRSSSETSTIKKKATSTNGTYELKAYVNGGMDEPLNDSFTATTAVRTVYEPVPLEYALHWPVMASFDEVLSCAKWMGGRIPTQEEVRSTYSYVEQGNTKDEKGVHASTIPAVNG
jgi:formylglycine-generating enzyme required for sulfatase activity